MAIAPNISATLLMEVSMDKHFNDKAYEEFCDYVKETVEDFIENHHLQFEISIAWDDDDEFEHEGYYDSVDDAIKALLKYKNIEK